MIEHNEISTQKETTQTKKRSPYSLKKIIPVFLIVVLIAGALIGGFYWGKSKATKKTEVKKVVRDLTADWETYVSEKYGFSFKYPEEWDVEYLEDKDIFQISKNEDDDTLINLRILSQRVVDSSKPCDAIQISIPFDKRNYIVFSTSTENKEKEIFYNIVATLSLN